MADRFSRGRVSGYGGGGSLTRDQENLNKLRQFESAESQAQKSDIAASRLNFAQDKFAFEQGMQIAAADRKVQESAMRQLAAEQQSVMAQKRLELEQAARLLAEQKQAMNIEDSLRATQDKIGFLRATSGLKEDDADFEKKLSEAMAGFPNASKDEFVQKRLGWLTESRTEHLKARRAKEAEDAAKAEAQKLGMAPSEIKAGATTFRAGDEKYGTETVDEQTGKRTVTRPIGPPNTKEEQQKEREKLLEQHDILQASLMQKSGKLFKSPDPTEIAAINTVKRKLGYDLLDENGKAIPRPHVDSTVPADTTSPAASPAAPATTLPTATNPATGQKMVYRDGKWQPS